jgi:2-C-methyl-D-erythritol 4-phosphate cytidylyltransferase/2-C-methyl-D-erythritol 2,4-cyclodiphosphate synthase
MHVTAIIAAGGRGQRFGGARPKQLLSVGGRPILERSVMAFASHPSVDALIVALPEGLADDPPAYLRRTGKPVRIVAGGERRQESVANAFRAAATQSAIIVIHDAARPFASADLIARTIDAAAESGAAVAALQSRDTVKRVLRPFEGLRVALSNVEGRQAENERQPLTSSASKGARFVGETLPRETIYLAQTPQAFQRDVLRRALEMSERDRLDTTDEAALVELAGLPVRIVDGEASNIKITTPEDLAVAEAIAQGLRNADRGLPRADVSPNEIQSAIRNPQSAMWRAGTGYDLHRLVAGRPLVLGGVTIPAERGALGHSDADVLCHAVTDAILGAASLGDIGRHFPDSDPRWKDANSIGLLRLVVQLVTEQGFMLGNVDVTVILETPKIRDHVDAMRASVAGAIGIDVARVSIKGKTNEGLDAVGRGEAIAAHAIALIRAI